MINIAFATNKNYAIHMVVAIASILSNNKSNRNICFYILHSELDSKDIQNIESVKKLATSFKVQFVFLNLGDKFSNYSLDGYFSKETMYRLLLADILTNIDKILYLDPDIVVIKDISKLYNENIDDFYIAGIKDLILFHLLRSDGKVNYKNEKYYWEDYYKHLGLSMEQMYSYVQAGVLLINLKKIRQDKKIDEINSIIDKYKYLIFNDQDVINIVFKDNIKFLDGKWNFTDPRNQLLYGNLIAKEYLEWGSAKKNPAIIHYTGKDKPWNFKKNYLLLYFNEYLKYRQKTVYRFNSFKFGLIYILSNIRAIIYKSFRIKETSKYIRIFIFGLKIEINWSKFLKF